jgi:thiol:disulfide interchange protein DsbC
VTKQKDRSEALSALKDADMVVFKPKDVKAKITIFTDIDCGYCRKLHQEIPRLNELGVQVAYAAFPRAGVGSSSYQKLVSVWCADSQQDAMTQAKNGQAVPAKTCANPVAAQYELGNKIGVMGTPAIILEDGRIIPGYVPADTIAKGLGLVN